MARPAPRTDGCAVLLLHGQPGSAADWRLVSSALPPTGATIAIDRPGWGVSSEPAGDLRANADTALDALDRAGVDSAVVVGHSFGGAVAAWLAAHHPERVEALLLLAPAANGASLELLDRWLALPVAGYVSSASLMAGVGATLAVGPARRLLAGALTLDESLLDSVGRSLRSPSKWHAFAQEQRALVRDLPLLEAALGSIRAATTIVIGEHDRIVPPRSARRLHEQIAGSQLVVLPDAGHLLPFQRAAELADLIGARLRSPGTSPAYMQRS
jgi:pimeloyl-ACP methyl ester carboxylesterase